MIKFKNIDQRKKRLRLFSCTLLQIFTILLVDDFYLKLLLWHIVNSSKYERSHFNVAIRIVSSKMKYERRNSKSKLISETWKDTYIGRNWWCDTKCFAQEDIWCFGAAPNCIWATESMSFVWINMEVCVVQRNVCALYSLWYRFHELVLNRIPFLYGVETNGLVLLVHSLFFRTIASIFE